VPRLREQLVPWLQTQLGLVLVLVLMLVLVLVLVRALRPLATRWARCRVHTPMLCARQQRHCPLRRRRCPQ
jgi:hypothetical protein